VLTPESAAFEEHVTAVLAEHGRYNPAFSDLEDFALLRVRLDGKPVGQAIEDGGLTPEIATAFWRRLREAGFIDFANIIYYSFVLLRNRPEILSYLAAKFAWILVDEFQDTTDL
jgi:DNA helicase-2/ATP-dependent DNA helicase PcrA